MVLLHIKISNKVIIQTIQIVKIKVNKEVGWIQQIKNNLNLMKNI
jgi:hypothetical protein